jgi:hypothetical protein
MSHSAAGLNFVGALDDLRLKKFHTDGVLKIIVGASVAGTSQNHGQFPAYRTLSGLASAIALKSSGHSVLVLEKDPHLGGIGSVSVKLTASSESLNL